MGCSCCNCKKIRFKVVSWGGTSIRDYKYKVLYKYSGSWFWREANGDCVGIPYSSTPIFKTLQGAFDYCSKFATAAGKPTFTMRIVTRSEKEVFQGSIIK